MVHHEAVRFVLPLHRFHNVPQVGFFVRQEGAERVYLCRAHILPTMGLQGLQQAVGAQAEDAVTCAVGFSHPMIFSPKMASVAMR